MKLLKKNPKKPAGFLFMIAVVISASFIFSMVSGDEMPETDGKSVWNYITEKNDYTQWDHWPGKTEMYEGQSPHGAFLRLYVNKQAYNALSEGKTEMPPNAIIVKENYNKEKELVAITPMYKKTGYNSEAGDWFWAKYGKEGKIMAEGQVESCIGCHSKVADKDYLFTE